MYFISANAQESFSAVMSAKTIYASRFLHLFWMPGLVKHAMANPPFVLKNQTHEEQILIKMMTEDIKTKKPKFILVDIKEHKIAFSFLFFLYFSFFF